jgi:cardiolipin synthase A/B
MTISHAARRRIAPETFDRTTGTRRIGGNDVQLLADAHDNFGAWISAIQSARTSVLFENYMFGDDEVGRAIVDALAERAHAGVHVFVVRDWYGCLGESRDALFDPVRDGGGEVRTFNPPQFTRPLEALSRDHRKVVVVDSEVTFVSGLCANAKWLGDPAHNVAPWRDTGISIRGPAVHDVALAFADTWSVLGAPLPLDLPVLCNEPPRAGSTCVRVIPTLPNTAGLFRVDQLVAAMAQESLWLSDAYFVGTAPYIQALCSAARDGVDVRLLVPGRSDVPVVGAITRAGYQVLLEAGVRIFEWNGTMLHAKTAVVDGRWSRVGSTNLNLASWMGNRELDVAIEDEPFARRMQHMYEEDLLGATEIVLDLGKGRVLRPARERPPGRRGAAVSALGMASAVGAAVSARRELGRTEAWTLLIAALVLAGVAVVAILWPRVVAWPLAVVAAWGAIALVARWVSMRKAPRRPTAERRSARQKGWLRRRARRAPG